MTVPEMHLALRMYIDKSTSLVGTVDFLPEEIDFWLNEAQERFIKQRMFGDNVFKTGFEQSSKRIEDLKSLLVQTNYLTLTASSFGANVKTCALPTGTSFPTIYVGTEYMYYINSDVKDSLGVSLQTADYIQQSEISKYIKDALNNPYIRRPFVFLTHKTLSTTSSIGNAGVEFGVVYGDEFVPATLSVTYIRRPLKLGYTAVPYTVTSTCELSDHTHIEIVNIAAELLLENIESPRVQTNTPINASKVE